MSLTIGQDEDLEKLKGRCNHLEAKMIKVMSEVLEELEHKKPKRRFSSEDKREIMTINNKTFNPKDTESNK